MQSTCNLLDIVPTGLAYMPSMSTHQHVILKNNIVASSSDWQHKLVRLKMCCFSKNGLSRNICRISFRSHTNYKCCVQYNYNKSLQPLAHWEKKRTGRIWKRNTKHHCREILVYQCVCVGEEFQDFYILFHSNNPVLSLFLYYRVQPHILYHGNLWSVNSEV